MGLWNSESWPLAIKIGLVFQTFQSFVEGVSGDKVWQASIISQGYITLLEDYEVVAQDHFSSSLSY